MNAFFKKNKIILITERRCIIIEEDPLDNYKLHDNFNESIDFEDLHTSGGIILEKALCCSESYDFREKGSDIIIAFKIKKSETADLTFKIKWLQD